MTIKDAVEKIRDNLSKVQLLGVDEDTMSLCQAIFSLDRTGLSIHGDEILTKEQENLVDEYLKRRLSGEPIQYIVGLWPFMDLNFKVGKGVLIPRDDTEVLVRNVDKLLNDNTNLVDCIDLCSGSGIIAITLKHMHPSINMAAVEKSEDAYLYLEKNISMNNVDIKPYFDDIKTFINRINDDSLDVLISNPPYVKTVDIPYLQKEISFEPKEALDGGIDGLDFYKLIISTYSSKIRNGGYIALEIGETQREDIKALLVSENFTDINVYKDIQNLDRAIIARKNF